MNEQNKNDSASSVVTGYDKKKLSSLSVSFLCLALLIWMLIFFREVTLSLKSYNPVKGISSSPWVGWANFNTVLSSFYFPRILFNTLVFNLLFALIAFIIPSLIGLILCSLPKGSIAKEIIAILFLLPLFLPGEVYGRWFIDLLSSRPFMNPSAMRFLHPLISAFKYLGIPVMVSYILDEGSEKKNSLLPMKSGALFSLACLAFIGASCFSLTKVLYNPMNYETMDMLDTYTFRRGLLEGDMSVNSASGVIQTFLSFLSAIVLFIPIKALFSATFKNIKRSFVKEKLSKRLVSSITALAIFSLIYFLPYIVKGYSFDLNKMTVPVGIPMMKYMLISIIVGLIAAALSALMSWGFISPNKRTAAFSAISLLLITVLSSKPINISQYLMIKSLGATNTYFAIVLSSGFSSAAVWAMASLLKFESPLCAKSFLLSFIGIFLIQAALIYGNSTADQIHFHDASLSPVLMYRQMSLGMQNLPELSERISLNNLIGIYGYIISLPALLLFILAKLALPGEKLLSIISGAMKS